MSLSLDDVVKIAQILAFGTGTIGILVSLFTYLKNNKVKRGEWLKSLYEKFYESEIYKDVRKTIGYEKVSEYLGLHTDGQVMNEDNEEKLINYLNFFEFIATLLKRKYIKQQEVEDLFDYYFRKIKADKFIKENYIEKEGYGFEKLRAFFHEYKQ
jgi:uncharacterized protein YebE (UPF0316 family)